MKTPQITLICFVLFLSTFRFSFAETKEIVSQTHTIDRTYQSMEGLKSTVHFVFNDNEKPNLIWLKKTHVEVIDKNNNVLSDKYLCHSNLHYDWGKKSLQSHNMNIRTSSWEKFVDLQQGNMEIEFPKNFGMPLLSNEPLSFHSMVINPQNVAEPFDVRVKTTFEIIHDNDTDSQFKPLSLQIIGLEVPNEHQTLTFHWEVPPGRHTYRQLQKRGTGIPFNTTIHYIAFHVHHFAESVELYDLTAQNSVFKGYITNLPDRIDHIDRFSSEKGIFLDMSHEYELIAVYNNPTASHISAMAIMYLYYFDKNFDKKQISLQHKP